MREDRRYSVLHRIWPGTQRLLIWGDPVTAAGYSRAFSFCGSSGVEIFEPLSFKGRRGSGLPGDRAGYADPALAPRHDWEKYEYSYRVWGRLLYNPDTDPDGWRRDLKNPAAETALASASRILPIVTTAHGPSAANNTYWPEIYTNQPMVDPRKKNPYTDTPAPRSFQAASPFDPQLFSRMTDFAGELLKGERGGKYSPVEVAQWLEDLAGAAAQSKLEARRRRCGGSRSTSRSRRARAVLRGQIPSRRAVCNPRADRRSHGTRRSVEAIPESTRDLGRNRGASQGCLRGRHYGGRTSLAPRALARPAARHRRGHRRHGQAGGESPKTAAIHGCARRLRR